MDETGIHTQENRRIFEWDETNRLARGTRGSDYGLYTSEYTYDSLGIRVNSTIMGSSYYYTNPETGSLLSSDPAKSGLNWHQYCGSNPTTYVDVMGLWKQKTLISN